MNILVTGGCGYKGSVLVPKLLSKGYTVQVLDIMWFGNFLKPHPKLQILNFDVRNISASQLKNVDCIIHLSSVANDPCGDLNPRLTWEISCLATMKLADMAAKNGVSRFIFASSGSVYGIKKEENVTEELDLVPISEYNKTKMVAERVLLSYKDNMIVQIVRPATVCGLSPRMRLDVSVNMLCMQALTKGRIKVFGGNQFRPNIHIDDITDLYIYLLDNPQLSGVYNAGYENLSILSLAKMIREEIGAEIDMHSSTDNRSYRINSDKLSSTGFKPKKNVKTAIREIKDAMKSGLLRDDAMYYNLDWMKNKIDEINK